MYGQLVREMLEITDEKETWKTWKLHFRAETEALLLPAQEQIH